MTDIAALTVKNRERWKSANLTRGPEFARVAQRLFKAKDRYKAVEKRTGVPWFVIAVIHQRESSQSWGGSLAQGDPWNRVSTHVPKGRGPFNSWEDAAVDALVACAPHAAQWKDWSAGGTMTLLEQYNGLGYANKGIPSPYIWSGTDQYRAGKYVADGVFDSNAVDKQLGCAGLILGLKALDPTVSFREQVSPTPPPPDIPKPEPKPKPETKPAVQSKTIWAQIATVLTALGGALTDWRVLAVIVVAALAGYVIWERLKRPDIRGIIKKVS